MLLIAGKDCADILKKFPQTQDKNGTYEITTLQNKKKRVYCDMTTEKGGWTVFFLFLPVPHIPNAFQGTIS
jgi:hypothetical protein